MLAFNQVDGNDLESVNRGCMKEGESDEDYAHGCSFSDLVETCTMTCHEDSCNSIPAGGPCSESDPLLFVKEWNEFSGRSQNNRKMNTVQPSRVEFSHTYIPKNYPF